MAKFGYRSRRKMDPRPGRTYATEYYKQGRQERARTQAFVERVIQQVGERALETPGGVETLMRPMKGFQRRETKGAYSAFDVLTDMLQQLESGKDIPSGILGRWNRLFEGTGQEIEMMPEGDLPPRNPTYEELFDDHRAEKASGS